MLARIPEAWIEERDRSELLYLCYKQLSRQLVSPRPDLLLRPGAMGSQDRDSTGQRVKIGPEKSGLAQLGDGAGNVRMKDRHPLRFR